MAGLFDRDRAGDRDVRRRGAGRSAVKQRDRLSVGQADRATGGGQAVRVGDRASVGVQCLGDRQRRVFDIVAGALDLDVAGLFDRDRAGDRDVRRRGAGRSAVKQRDRLSVGQADQATGGGDAGRGRYRRLGRVQCGRDRGRGITDSVPRNEGGITIVERVMLGDSQRQRAGSSHLGRVVDRGDV